MPANYVTTIISTQEVSMSHITSTSGSLAQAPVSSVAASNHYHPALLDGGKKSSTKSSTPVQNSLTKRYIIYIMENKNSKINNSLTHS